MSFKVSAENKFRLFSASRFANARILVVDDSPVNVKLICSTLTAAGYKVLETAKDGLDALDKTYRLIPDLVLLDIMMPNLDGFGYIERLKGDPNAPRMPIIVQTALGEREAKIRALSIGANDFLNKPLDLEELVLRVHVHLERYFMLQDMEQMRSYLKMELEKAQSTIKQLEGTVPTQATKQLGRHYEVLETLTIEPNSKPN
jgi:DNA-binding response OmpR family regulator